MNFGPKTLCQCEFKEPREPLVSRRERESERDGERGLYRVELAGIVCCLAWLVHEANTPHGAASRPRCQHEEEE